MSLRLAHFSDVHLTTHPHSWRSEDWFNKRLAAWLNVHLGGRGHRFRHGEAILAALTREFHDRRPDWLVFSGDASAMGFHEEAALTGGLLPLTQWPGIAVPGNHDYCTRTAQREEVFEQVFDLWQRGVRVDDARYPFACRAGDAWLIGLNSATGNLWPWDARGKVGKTQLGRLKRLLEELDGPGPKILVTHYPVVRPSGWREPVLRHLRDLDDVLRVCAAGGVAAWLHGHIHTPFHFPKGRFAPFPIICAGSATQTGLWSYGEYEIDAGVLKASVREYDQETNSFREVRRFEVELG